MKPLLTGFGPFGDVVDNPSARMAEHFAEGRAPGHELTVRIVQVWLERATEEIARLLTYGRYDLCLMLGAAGRESQIRVETYARNEDSARIPSCDGREPMGVISESGPELYRTPLDAGLLTDSLLEAGISARVSESAGSYVSNRAYYAALHAVAAQNFPNCCLFVPVPPRESTFIEPADSAIPLQTQITAIQCILAMLPGIE